MDGQRLTGFYLLQHDELAVNMVYADGGWGIERSNWLVRELWHGRAAEKAQPSQSTDTNIKEEEEGVWLKILHHHLVTKTMRKTPDAPRTK